MLVSSGDTLLTSPTPTFLLSPLALSLSLSVLGSGSRGNATFIKTDSVRILIDAGLSRKEIGKRLESIGEDPDGIDAVLVTHEHNDHGAGLRTLLKELSIHAYLTPGTLRGLQPETFDMNGSEIHLIAAGIPFTVGDAEITPFAVPHDANEPTAFSISCQGLRITQLTDAGHLSESVASRLAGANCLILGFSSSGCWDASGICRTPRSESSFASSTTVMRPTWCWRISANGTITPRLRGRKRYAL